MASQPATSATAAPSATHAGAQHSDNQWPAQKIVLLQRCQSHWTTGKLRSRRPGPSDSQLRHRRRPRLAPCLASSGLHVVASPLTPRPVANCGFPLSLPIRYWVAHSQFTHPSPQAFAKDLPVHQVNISTTDGDCGILAGHVPSIFQLEPGLVEVFEGGPAGAAKKSFFFGTNAASSHINSVSTVAHACKLLL